MNRHPLTAVALLALLPLTGCTFEKANANEVIQHRLEAVPGVSNVKIADYLPEESILTVTKIELDMANGDESSLAHLLSELRAVVIQTKVHSGRAPTTVHLPNGKELAIAAAEYLHESVPGDLARMTAPEGVTRSYLYNHGDNSYTITLVPDRLDAFCSLMKAHPIDASAQVRMEASNTSKRLTCP